MKNRHPVHIVLTAVISCVLGLGFLALDAQNTSTSAAAPATTTKASPPAPAGPSALTPTELQKANLHVAQLQLAIASNNVQAALQEFNRVCGAIIAENKWPEGTRCDPQTMNIVPPAPAAIVPPAPKPEPAKKK